MKKKLLILVNELSFFISHRFEIAEAAINKGYDVKIAYGELGNMTKRKLSKIKIDCFQVPLHRGVTNPFKELVSIIALYQIFKKLKPDIVHLVTIKSYLYGGIAARFSHVKCVVSAVAGLGIIFNNRQLLYKILRKILFPIFYLAFSHRNQKIIVQNLHDKKILVSWGVVDKKKIEVFPGSGVNLDKFIKINEKYTNKKITICLASRLIRDKGIYDFIDASKILKKRGIESKFLLAGSIDIKNPNSLSEKEMKNIQKDNFLEVVGFIKDIPTLYAKSHIVCLPSYYGEGIPKTLIEAAAASRAIVTTDHPGCRDAVIPNKTGLLVPIQNPKKLADVLQWLIEHPKDRIAMGKAGRKLAEKKFNLKKIVQMHLDIYGLLLKKIL
jgi:glycosyltransferase involved in cell wall biosynthesis